MAKIDRRFGELDSLQSLSRCSLADDIYNQISKLIIEGKLQPGFTFPNEIIFCQNLGVGRSTLREAFRALETMGFIVRSKRGTSVSAKPRNEVLPFPLILKESCVQDTIELRIALEVRIAALAAERATEEDVAKMSLALKNMKNNVADIPTLTFYDGLFHYQMAEASGNKLLIAMVKMVRESVETGMIVAFEKDSQIANRAIQFHGRLLEAIKRREQARAGDIAMEHIMDVATTLKV